MKRLATSLAITALLGALAASSASASFGLKDLDVTFNNENGSIATQAGAHSFSMTTTVGFNTRPAPEVGYEIPDEDVRNLRIAQMEGLVGNPTVVPTCTNAEFLGRKCPATSQVGFSDITYGEPGQTERFPVYSITPPPGVAMKLGFTIVLVPVTVELGVNESFPSNVIAALNNIPNVLSVYRSAVTLWGVPADTAHDLERKAPGCNEGCSINLAPKPFLTTPRACTGPLTTAFKADSWLGSSYADSILTHDDAEPTNPLGMTGCGKLGFGPSITAQPTAKAAQSPTGLDFALDVKDEGLTSASGLANSDIRKAVVTLPEGFSTNPSIAEGLNTCSEADLDRESVNSEPGAGCPDTSKIGTVEVETPLLEDKSVNGSLFIAKPYENPFGSLLALYMVIKNPQLGIVVKQAMRVENDPVTGRITTVADNLPQLPFSHFKLHFREGTRSPLATPPGCGTYNAEATLTPWAGGSPITTTSAFEVNVGPNGGGCPSGGMPPFKPGLMAGTINNAAGTHSPFNLRLSRNDGEQEFTHFSIKLPPGIVAKLAGVPFCSDAAIAAAKARTGPHGGQEEQLSFLPARK